MSSHIESVISRIPRMTAKESDVWRDKARNVLSKKPGDPDAKRLIAALGDSPTQSAVESWISTGLIAWEPGGNDRPTCLGYADGIPVARIFKNATHTANRKKVYSVEVMGATLPDRFHYIGDARQAGESDFRQRRSG
jgi:hypothetical protein